MNDDNIIPWRGSTTVDMPAEKVLEDAKADNLKSVLVIGRTQEGELYTSSTTSDLASMLLDVEMTRQRIIDWALDRDP